MQIVQPQRNFSKVEPSLPLCKATEVVHVEKQLPTGTEVEEYVEIGSAGEGIVTHHHKRRLNFFQYFELGVDLGDLGLAFDERL
jgi:hypothetical protein